MSQAEHNLGTSHTAELSHDELKAVYGNVPPEVIDAVRKKYKAVPAIITMILTLIQSLIGGGGDISKIIATILALFHIPVPTPTPTPTPAPAEGMPA